MREEQSKEAVRLLQALITRETGKPLMLTAESELTAIVQHALGLGVDCDIADDRNAFVRREVTILIADLRGFTAITAVLPPDTVISMLNRCLGRMNEVISLHHGFVDKFMGDSIMVLFGVPEEHPDDAKRALTCAIDMQSAMVELNRQNLEDGIPEMFMGIGINTGSVMAGRFGSNFYSEYTVVGEEVNIASRIESFSLRGQILIGENTFDECRDFVTVSDVLEVFVKGKTQPIKLRELYSIPSLNIEVQRKEARRSHRMRVNLPCIFHQLKKKIVMPKKHSAVIRDIGYHGLLIENETPLEVLEDIKLEFYIPLVDFNAFEVYAKVVQSTLVGEQHLTGIEFTSLSPDTNMKIHLFVQMLMTAEQE